MAEGWWRLLRKHAFAGQTFADTTEIAYAVEVAIVQLNTDANPGGGDDRHHQPANAAASSCTGLSKRRISRRSEARVNPEASAPPGRDRGRSEPRVTADEAVAHRVERRVEFAAVPVEGQFELDERVVVQVAYGDPDES